MKIGIHQEPSSPAIGGADFVVALLAHYLREGNEVEIVGHRPQVSIRDLSDFFQLDLEGVGWRCFPRSTIYFADTADRWWRPRTDQSRRCACLSNSYDLFITVTHWVPPFCYAPRGILYVLFPDFNRKDSWPWNESVSVGLRGTANRFRRYLYEHAWQSRMATYEKCLAISQFAADWTARYWGVSCDVLPPPVSCDFSESVKANQIAVLGRFTPSKKQKELVAAFHHAHRGQLAGWSMACLGGLPKSPADQAYFEEVKEEAGAAPIRLFPNAPRPVLHSELERSKLFWHGMGLGEDEDQHPIRVEHFGIATVEAMAAGCVPVVINKGGQREIVEQGVSGFLCESVEEMVEVTARLATNEVLRARMASAAVARAQEYRAERFFQRFLEMTSLGETAISEQSKIASIFNETR